MDAKAKTALVLSAGGMFGAYQAGVWEVLEAVWKPDIVVGASVGSLNAWLIASGCSGRDLVRRWLDLEHLAELRWRIPQTLSDGILDPSRLEALIQEMCSTSCPVSTELGIVATELRTMKPRLFRTAEITWQHIAASCAVPVFLRHYRLNGIRYSDGGLIDPLPLWGAAEMGATNAIAVDLLKNRIPWIETLMRRVHTWTGYSRPSQEALRTWEIAPSQYLGSARDSMNWTRSNAERWINLGRRDAEAALAAVECFSQVSQGVPLEKVTGCTSTVFTA